MLQKATPKSLVLDAAADVAGCLLMAVGTQAFSAPNNIAPGGVTGISIILNYLFNLPISIVSLVINIPLLLLAFWFLGKKFTLKTLKTVLIMTLMLWLVEWSGFTYQGDRILAALSGGVLGGIGLSLVFMRTSTTGGTDIIARLIQLRFPDLAVGRLLLLVDAVILAAAALVYRNLESALFALITIFTRTQILDSILCGLDMGKVLLVVSNQGEEMAGVIGSRLGRGCTLLDGRGSYTKENRPVLLCVVRRSQYYELKQLVNSTDPEAFIIAMEANEIIGKGFKPFTTGP